MNAIVPARLCIYCGRSAEDYDHVPPKCLFQRPSPSDLLTVPSRRVCNRKFSFDDEFFRDAVGKLRMLGRGKLVILLYAARDPEVNHARVLRSVLQRGSKRGRMKSAKKPA